MNFVDLSREAASGPPSSEPPSRVHRADIDGLRAVAVVAVLLYHLRVKLFGGGFVGVDMFFVISGYLISSIIIGELAENRFSIAHFYARRVRRIVPAFIGMIGFTTAMSALFLFPSEFERTSESMLYAAFSVSNLYFLHHTGYFQPHAYSQPLLHTWSLAVEEQFYLFFPLFMIVVCRYAGRFLGATVFVVALASLACSAYGAFSFPDAAFYLAPMRAWELLLGTLLAIRPTARINAAPRNTLSLLGFLLIAGAVFCYDFDTPFPGVAALLPCLGTAFIIAAGQSGPSLVGRVLSAAPLVFTGVISYSLYLWHWPIIVFQVTHPFLPGAAIVGDRIAVILFSFGAAVLSWRLLEQPFRRMAASEIDTSVLTAGLLSLGVVAALAITVIGRDGFPSRFSPDADRYAAYLDTGQAHFRAGKCFLVIPDRFADFDRHTCLGSDPAHPNDLLIGDSHAAHLWYGLSTTFPQIHVQQATSAGCIPQLQPPASAPLLCRSLMTYLFNTYLPRNGVGRLLLAADWHGADMPRLEDLLIWARQRGISVTLFGPMIGYDLELPRLMADAAEERNPGLVERHVIRNPALDDAMRSMAAKHGAKYVSLYRALCADLDCTAFSTHVPPLEFDRDHLTQEGSIFVAQALADSGQMP